MSVALRPSAALGFRCGSTWLDGGALDLAAATEVGVVAREAVSRQERHPALWPSRRLECRRASSQHAQRGSQRESGGAERRSGLVLSTTSGTFSAGMASERRFEAIDGGPKQGHNGAIFLRGGRGSDVEAQPSDARRSSARSAGACRSEWAQSQRALCHGDPLTRRLADGEASNDFGASSSSSHGRGCGDAATGTAERSESFCNKCVGSQGGRKSAVPMWQRREVQAVSR
jgi:hypothetical protein